VDPHQERQGSRTGEELMSDYKIISRPAESTDYKIVDQAPTPLALEPSPLDRMLGREATVPEVGSLRDTIERKRRGMPTKSEYDARTVDAQLTDAVAGAGKYDPDVTFESIHNDWMVDLGFSDKNTEKFRKFKRYFPKGDLVFVPTDGGTEILARASDQEPFRKLGRGGEYTASAIKAVPSVIAGVATGGLGLPAALAVQGAVGAGASAGFDILESLRGYQDSSAGDIAIGAGVEGALGAAMEVPARFLTGAMGRTTEDILTSYKDLATAGSDIPILSGQVGHPIKTTLFNLIRKYSPRAKLALREQRAKIRSLIDEKAPLTPEQLASMGDDELANYVELFGSDVILAKLGTTGSDRYATGVALRTAVNRLRDVGRYATDARFADAFEYGKYEYWNAKPVQDYAEELLQPVVGRGKRVPDENGVLPMGDDAYPDVRLSASHPELIKIAKDLKALDPVVALHKGFSGVKQLMALRTRVGELGQLENLSQTQADEARLLYDKLTETINNPFSGNPTFIAKWQEAVKEHKMFNDFLRSGEVKAALAEGKSAEKVAEKFLAPGDYDSLKVIKENFNADPETVPAWNALKQGFIGRFTRSTEDLSKAGTALAKYSDRELGLILDPVEIRNLRMASVQAQRILRGDVNKALREFDTEGERILELANKGKSDQINRLVEKAGGINSDVAGALRAGVFQNILDKASYIDPDTGLEVMDPRMLSTMLSEMRKSRRLNALFTDTQWRQFENWEKVATVVGREADDGVSIQAGEVAADLARAPFNPGLAAKLVLELNYRDTLGYLLSRPANFEKVLRAGENMSKKRRDRALVNAMGQVLGDLQFTYSSREDLDPMTAEQRAMDVLQENPSIMDRMRQYFRREDEARQPPPSEPLNPMPPAPVPGQQGALQPRMAPASMPTTNMATAMPPQAPAPMQQGIAGTRYSALFPGDTLGAMAASGGIASLRG